MPVLIADVVEAMFRAVVEVPGAHEDILHLGAHAIEALGQDPDDYSDSDLLQAGVAFAGHWYGWWVKSQLEEGGHG